jgi:nucleotide-binding universal stress UspA family protein
MSMGAMTRRAKRAYGVNIAETQDKLTNHIENAMFRRLLLAIDDSPSGEVAVDFTTALAQRCSASVHVLFVNEYLVGGQGISLLTKDEATELLTSAVTQLHAAGIATSGSSVVDSYRRVATRVAEAARERDADAIVLGSHRRRRFGRLFSTQVREQTTRITELPVLTAPSPLEVVTRGRAETIDLNVQLQDFMRSSS